jgi:hypothetical protein
MTWPRRFYLLREQDRSGISGLGHVADGVQFTDGTVVLHWCSAYPATTIWRRLTDLLAVHGHGDTTRVCWLDGSGPAGTGTAAP